MNRLESMDAQLAMQVKNAHPEKRLAMAVSIAKTALADVKLNSTLTTDVLHHLDSNGVVPQDLQNELRQLAEELDGKYFDAQDAGDKNAVVLFGQARAVSSLIFAIKGLAWESAQDAVYEATATIDDPKPILRKAYDLLIATA